MEVDFYKIHLQLSSDSDSESDGKDEFDEQYYKFLPKPVDLKTLEENCVVIRCNQNDNSNFTTPINNHEKISYASIASTSSLNEKLKDFLNRVNILFNLNLQINLSDVIDIKNKFIVMEESINKTNDECLMNELIQMQLECGVYEKSMGFIIPLDISKVTLSNIRAILEKLEVIQNFLKTPKEKKVYLSSNKKVLAGLYYLQEQLFNTLNDCNDKLAKKEYFLIFNELKRKLGVKDVKPKAEKTYIFIFDISQKPLIVTEKMKKKLENFLKHLKLKLSISDDLINIFMEIEERILQLKNQNHEKQFIRIKMEFCLYILPKKYRIKKYKQINETVTNKILINLYNFINSPNDLIIDLQSKNSTLQFITLLEQELIVRFKTGCTLKERITYAGMFYELRNIFGLEPLLTDVEENQEKNLQITGKTEKQRSPVSMPDTKLNSNIKTPNSSTTILLNLLTDINKNMFLDYCDVSKHFEALQNSIRNCEDGTYKDELLGITFQIQELMKNIAIIKCRSEIPGNENVKNNFHKLSENQKFQLSDILYNIKECFGFEINISEESENTFYDKIWQIKGFAEMISEEQKKFNILKAIKDVEILVKNWNIFQDTNTTMLNSTDFFHKTIQNPIGFSYNSKDSFKAIEFIKQNDLTSTQLLDSANDNKKVINNFYKLTANQKYHLLKKTYYIKEFCGIEINLSEESKHTYYEKFCQIKAFAEMILEEKKKLDILKTLQDVDIFVRNWNIFTADINSTETESIAKINDLQSNITHISVIENKKINNNFFILTKNRQDHLLKLFNTLYKYCRVCINITEENKQTYEDKMTKMLCFMLAITDEAIKTNMLSVLWDVENLVQNWNIFNAEFRTAPLNSSNIFYNIQLQNIECNIGIQPLYPLYYTHDVKRRNFINGHLYYLYANFNCKLNLADDYMSFVEKMAKIKRDLELAKDSNDIRTRINLIEESLGMCQINAEEIHNNISMNDGDNIQSIYEISTISQNTQTKTDHENIDENSYEETNTNTVDNYDGLNTQQKAHLQGVLNELILNFGVVINITEESERTYFETISQIESLAQSISNKEKRKKMISLVKTMNDLIKKGNIFNENTKNDLNPSNVEQNDKTNNINKIYEGPCSEIKPYNNNFHTLTQNRQNHLMILCNNLNIFCGLNLNIAKENKQTYEEKMNKIKNFVETTTKGVNSTKTLNILRDVENLVQKWNMFDECTTDMTSNQLNQPSKVEPNNFRNNEEIENIFDKDATENTSNHLNLPSKLEQNNEKIEPLYPFYYSFDMEKRNFIHEHLKYLNAAFDCALNLADDYIVFVEKISKVKRDLKHVNNSNNLRISVNLIEEALGMRQCHNLEENCHHTNKIQEASEHSNVENSIKDDNIKPICEIKTLECKKNSCEEIYNVIMDLQSNIQRNAVINNNYNGLSINRKRELQGFLKKLKENFGVEINIAEETQQTYFEKISHIECLAELISNKKKKNNIVKLVKVMNNCIKKWKIFDENITTDLDTLNNNFHLLSEKRRDHLKQLFKELKKYSGININIAEVCQETYEFKLFLIKTNAQSTPHATKTKIFEIIKDIETLVKDWNVFIEDAIEIKTHPEENDVKNTPPEVSLNGENTNDNIKVDPEPNKMQENNNQESVFPENNTDFIDGDIIMLYQFVDLENVSSICKLSVPDIVNLFVKKLKKEKITEPVNLTIINEFINELLANHSKLEENCTPTLVNDNNEPSVYLEDCLENNLNPEIEHNKRTIDLDYANNYYLGKDAKYSTYTFEETSPMQLYSIYWRNQNFENYYKSIYLYDQCYKMPMYEYIDYHSPAKNKSNETEPIVNVQEYTASENCDNGQEARSRCVIS